MQHARDGLARKSSENQRVTWNSMSPAIPLARAASARSRKRRGASAPYHAVVSIRPSAVARFGIEPAERQRNAAAHRAAGDGRRRPPDVIEQLREVAREEFGGEPHGTAIGLSVAAAVVGEHLRFVLQPV